MSKAILFVNLNKENARDLADEIVLGLENLDFQTDVFTFKGESNLSHDYNIAFSLGGDGTVLYTARAMSPLGVPIVPINMGTLGFIAAVRPENWKQVFDSWLKIGRASCRERV